MRAVLFDVDGTLFDHEGAARDALRTWLPTLGVEADDQLLARWFDAEERHVPDWRAGLISWSEQRRRLREVLPSCVVPSADDRLDLVFAGYLRAYEGAWRSFEDVDETLAQLHAGAVRLGILTNGSTEQQLAKLAALKLSNRFEFVLTAEDLGLAKPDPAAYLAACQRFGLSPRHVLHVGDLPDLDVDAPRAAGLNAVLIDREDRYRDPSSLRTLLDLRAHIDAAS